MNKWIAKAIVQKTISHLPFSNNINYIFQKYVTKGVFLTDEYFLDRLGHAREHITAYRNHTKEAFPKTALELGTGWYPVVPISLFLCGTEKIYSVDISFLTSKERILVTLQRFIKYYNDGFLLKTLDVDVTRYKTLIDIVEKYNELSLEEILHQLKITYLIEDARKLSLDSDSIDLVNSNNTFEHIYPEILGPIMADFLRVVKKKGGVMSHFIDMSDHFAHFDKKINIYNFLKFSDKQWHWIDNSIQPQNRMRVYEYKDLYAQVGIHISHETLRPGDLKQLSVINLDKRFLEHKAEEVAVSHCHFISDFVD